MIGREIIHKPAPTAATGRTNGISKPTSKRPSNTPTAPKRNYLKEYIDKLNGNACSSDGNAAEKTTSTTTGADSSNITGNSSSNITCISPTDADSLISTSSSAFQTTRTGTHETVNPTNNASTKKPSTSATVSKTSKALNGKTNTTERGKGKKESAPFFGFTEMVVTEKRKEKADRNEREWLAATAEERMAALRSQHRVPSMGLDHFINPAVALGPDREAQMRMHNSKPIPLPASHIDSAKASSGFMFDKLVYTMKTDDALVKLNKMAYKAEESSNDVLTLKQRFQNKRIELVEAGEGHQFVSKTDNARPEGFSLDQAFHELKHGNHGSFQHVERVIYRVSDPKTHKHETVSTMEVMISLGGKPQR